jgi:ribosomal protein S18 acetylase RimI-like enzyme
MNNAVTRHGAIKIQLACNSDVPAIVRVHQAGFPGFFLTFLGPRFLGEFYTALLDDPDGMGFVACAVTGVCGFVVGTAQPAGFYRRLLQHRGWRFALASMASALRRPSVAPRLLRAFSLPERTRQNAGRGSLLSIAVLPQFQGQGIGQTLVGAFLQEAAHRDLRQIDLTTDRNGNDTTNRFYQHLGFVCERTFVTPEGRVMNEYVIDLSPLARLDAADPHAAQETTQRISDRA